MKKKPVMGRPTLGDEPLRAVAVMLSQAQITALDDYGHARRLGGRSAVVRAIIDAWIKRGQK